MRSTPKQPRRSDEQRDEEPVQGQDLYRRAPREAQPEDQHDHGDQRLSERRYADADGADRKHKLVLPVKYEHLLVPLDEFGGKATFIA